MAGIAHNLAMVKGSLPQGVRLVAVSKNQPVERILEAYRGGQRLFGENRVQELMAKRAVLPEDIEWHLIGHLQTNKVRMVIPIVDLIHSIDSYRLMAEVSKAAISFERKVDCLLQVHIAEEETKFGLDEEELETLLRDHAAGRFPGIAVRGLMGMATFTTDEDQVRKEFRALKSLFQKMKERFFSGGSRFNELSMGMSGDYQIAIGEGSTLVRIGTALFGER
jgi:hypothetical protein